MSYSSTLYKYWQELKFRSNGNRALAPASSTATRYLAITAAAALVCASAGFGSVYAWVTGSQHGLLLGVLSVVMAVALEITKPLALLGALAALGSLRLIKGLAMLLLAAVGVSYSLTAELSLMSGARGDLVASRQASIKASHDADADVQRARSRYESAKSELDALPSSRPIAELQSLIDGLLLTPGADGCAQINGAVTRSICPRVGELKTELGRAQRRAELEDVMSAPIPVSSHGQHEVHAADPAASALSVYLSALGIVVSAATLTEWLGLVPVLALEVGSALAGVLVSCFAPTKPDRPTSQVSSKPSERRRQRVDTSLSTGVVELLKKNGGVMEAGQRRIASLLGVSKSRVGQIVHELAASGTVVLDTSRSGTRLALV